MELDANQLTYKELPEGVVVTGFADEARRSF